MVRAWHAQRALRAWYVEGSGQAGDRGATGAVSAAGGRDGEGGRCFVSLKVFKLPSKQRVNTCREWIPPFLFSLEHNGAKKCF